MKKILIIQTAFIGDVILATSLVETIHKVYGTDCQIDFLVRKGNESLLLDHPFLNQIYIWDKKQHKYSNLIKLIRRLRKTDYDFVYNLQRFATMGFLTWRLKSKIKAGFIKNPFAFGLDRKIVHTIGDGSHEIQRNFSLIAPDLPAETELIKPKLYPSKQDESIVDEILGETQSFYVLAPASVWFTKQLPKHKWVELLGSLKDVDKIYLIGAPSDSTFLDKIINSSDCNYAVNLAGKLTLLQSAVLIRRAKRSFVNDSAPLHLASATNAPVTAFFCSTIPEFGFGPLSDDVVIAQTAEKLDCRPCGLHGFKSCPKGHFKCGNQIQIEPLTD